MKGPARLSCRSGVARSGASRSGALLTAADRLDKTTAWTFDDISDRRRTEQQLDDSWVQADP